MYIHEIVAGSKISLQAYGENGSASLQSEVVQTGKNEIYVELFEHGDIRIGFESTSIRYDLLLIRENEVPLSWPGVKIGKVEIEGKLYHSIYSKDIGVKYNRRTCYRQFIGEEGTAQSLVGNEKLNVIVKDISSHGIGILLDKNIAGKIPEGTVIQISFHDPEMHERVELQSRIVRHEELDRQMLYGGTLTRSYPSLDRYIARKQLRNGVNRRR